MTIRQGRVEPELRAPSSLIADYLRKSISISYLLGLVLAGRVIVIVGAVMGLLYGIYTVHSAGPRYQATIRVSPAESDTSVGNLASAGGFFAGLAGASSVAVPKFTLFLSAIGSVGVAQELIRDHDMLCVIYAGDCDLETHAWKERTGVKEWINKQLASLGGLPNPNGARTERDLAMYLAGTVVVETNKNNSIVSLRYTHRKPELAAQYLGWVVKAANDYVRGRQRETQLRYVEYLSQSAAKTTNVEQRLAIDNLLLQEERQLMMTEVDIPYAAKILDGPLVEPVNKVLKTLAIYAIAGLLIGAAIAMCRDLLPRKWRVW